MPELPEVEITTQKLQPLIGKRIVSFWTDWPRALRVTKNPKKISTDIRGRRILKIRRKGKMIFFELGLKNATERILAFHQRMSGSFQIADFRFQISDLRSKHKHVHVLIVFSGKDALLFRDPRKFGVVWYGEPEKVFVEKHIASLGPDALGVSFEEFRERLLGLPNFSRQNLGGRAHKGAIKPLLMRQDIFAGIGNIVADEMLWFAKTHPLRRISSLKPQEIKNLFRSLKMVLQKSIRAKGTSMRDWQHPDGGAGNFQKLFSVYGRKNEKCKRCGYKIQRIVVGSRGTWFCVKCQKV